MGGDNSSLINAGLPNIKGQFELRAGVQIDNSPTGAFYFSNGPLNYANVTTNEKNTKTNQITFSASNSNTLYGSSNTVQPPAFALIPQIKF